MVRRGVMRSSLLSVVDLLIYVLLICLALLTLLPILHVFSVSLSSSQTVLASKLMLYPKEPTLESYKFIFRNDVLLRSLGITVFITVVGTFLNLLFTTTAAYVLSRRDLPGAAFFLMMIVVTMLFSAGIIPGYMLIRSLGLINSVWAMILPGLISAFNLILMRNFFWSVPEGLIESARIDGAGEVRTLVQIMLPLSLPALATIGLFYAVGHWNEFFRGIFYMTDSKKWPLQVLMRSIIAQADMNELGLSNQQVYQGGKLNVLTIQSATIIAATMPILAVYPFLQKYFVRGILIGAVKG
ncbi:carbohydrate ABC transporter permease [Paenibacillus thalictri]|uniref:Carbohydrate ABC transporter permease n=2 Tax=Paenibacillus thalictri TaxID=2527873 RepID=A0A4Q9DP44_9BACL|nr:carbohydrate ABC transporter permease [Paenibacillus thalictri]